MPFILSNPWNVLQRRSLKPAIFSEALEFMHKHFVVRCSCLHFMVQCNLYLKFCSYHNFLGIKKTLQERRATSSELKCLREIKSALKLIQLNQCTSQQWKIKSTCCCKWTALDQLVRSPWHYNFSFWGKYFPPALISLSIQRACAF